MNTDRTEGPRPTLDWLDPLKGLALLAILLNHLVEEFGPGPWFTNPTDNWPDFATRWSQVFPDDSFLPLAIVRFLGWLGDSGPGVFILLSGVGLAWGAIHAPEGIRPLDFYARRLTRIYPLYIAMHFVILTGSLFIPNSDFSMASRHTLFSVLGLRCTDSLFFYICPSWWFVGLILQLYLLFPFLYSLLRRMGNTGFVVLTVAFTFLARGLALQGLRSGNLYFWMTGLFFGTRLAEFSAGMVVVSLVAKGQGKEAPRLRGSGLLFGSMLAYGLGLGCSLTWAGSIASNFLVTLGLSGLFYFAWQHVIKPLPASIKIPEALAWIGSLSYGVFLFHQTPLKWTGALLPGNTPLHAVAALSLLALSFPAAAWINKAVTQLQFFFSVAEPKALFRAMTSLGSLCVLVVLLLIEPRAVAPIKYRAVALFLGYSISLLILSDLVLLDRDTWLERLLRWSAVFAGSLQLFLVPERSGPVSICAGGTLGLISIAAYALAHSRVKALAAASVLSAVLVATSEVGLAYFAPLEAGQWGELPALQIHPTRVYALKPNQKTRLRYNNYDYVVRTNSLGLASPEVNVERPTQDTFRVLVIGDAFSMPEGLEYEKAYPALLEKLLSMRLAPRPVQVINAGVTGYGPAEECPQLRELAPLLKPDVILFQFFINEFFEASLSRDHRLLNIGLVPTMDSFVVRLLRRSQTLAHLRRVSTEISEHLTGKPAPWRYSKALLEYYRAGDNSLYYDESIAKVRSYLIEMNAVAKTTGSRMVLCFVPGAVQVSKPSDINYFPWDQDLSDKALYDLERPLSSLKILAQSIGIPLVDLTPYLKEAPDQPVYFPDSWHWNEKGHAVVAKTLEAALDSLGFLGK